MENIIAVSFERDENAGEALAALEKLDAEGELELNEAAVLVRAQDGRVEIRDEIPGLRLEGTAAGGLLGLLIGILGGPLGILIGPATGVVAGSLRDVYEGHRAESALVDISHSLPVGRATVLADVKEHGPAVVDAAMEPLGGAIIRQSLEDVEAEVAAAAGAQREAARAARKHLFEHRREQHREAVRATVESLKADLHRHGHGPAAGAA